MFNAKTSEQLNTIGKNTYNFAISTATFWQVVCLIFIVSKIAGYISWSWWWVFIPLWGPFALILGIAIIILIGLGLFLGVCYTLDKIIQWYKKRKKDKINER